MTIPFLIDDPLIRLGDAFHVRIGSDTLPMLQDGQPFGAFLPGWRADALFTGFAPLFLLELVHEDTGARATWFLDHRMQMVGNHPDNLLPGLSGLLKSRAASLLQPMMTEITDRVLPMLDDRMEAFLRVNPATRAMVAGLCLELLVRTPASCRTTDLPPRSLVVDAGQGREVLVDRDHLDRGLLGSWQDRIAGFVEAGRPSWPSPVDGHPVDAQGSVVFDDFHFAYRFADHRNGLVFYVIVADHLSRIAGIWLPAIDVLAARDDRQLDLGGLLAPRIPHWFVFHALAWAGSLVPYLRRGADRIASVTRAPPGMHLGHQLWNELSGIDRLVRARPATLPDWIALDAARGSELYGPIDAIFPELAGRVERGIGGIAELIAHAYANGVLVLRVTDEFVSAALRRRILDRVESLAVARQVRDTVAVLDPPAMLVIGLRVENRTLTDLQGGLLRIVDFLAARHPGLVVVLDGHNALDVPGPASAGAVGTILGSHGEHIARRRPIDVERELVSTLRRQVAGRPVTILDTIGQPMSASLAWTVASDGFLSIWGASLAKYRWVCNKPGYVLSNRTNLLHRGALLIYSDPCFMEAPAPILFVSHELVTDDPGAALLVDTTPGNPGSFNFRVDVDGMLAEIGHFVDGLADRRRDGRHRS